ncbi:MAG: hypothetical protein A3E87_06715 [Gammaproteobacteria bacterium RIFCSPHIGHO2_12_FULL_35_23]|nr:MAG: hypothetical protein A3E87_06715 [Gammaproteobacteria bacterium RIFCSPHIGHO2_12_FULL_35_23]
MRKGFIFSICFHTTILLLLVISFHINKTVNSGIMQTEQVYLPQAFIANQVSLQSFTASTTTAALAKNGISPSVAINSTSSQNKQTLTKKSGQINKLLMIIHNKIQVQINSESNNLPDFLQGKPILLSFDLLPNGTIINIKTLHSSHNTLLDRLAIQAVQEITPILIAKKFIREMQPLKIRIIFK